jgi:hypothetical protein
MTWYIMVFENMRFVIIFMILHRFEKSEKSFFSKIQIKNITFLDTWKIFTVVLYEMCEHLGAFCEQK